MVRKLLALLLLAAVLLAGCSGGFRAGDDDDGDGDSDAEGGGGVEFDDEEDNDKDSPGAGILVLGTVLACAAIARRVGRNG